MSIGVLITLIVLALLLCGSLIAIILTHKSETFYIYFKKFVNWLGRVFKQTIVYPVYILTHPIKGYNDFKVEKKGKISVSIFLLLLYVLITILEYKYTGMSFNENDKSKLQSIMMLIYIVVPVVLITVANWSVTTLMNGKGKMKEIFMMICYSLFPIIVTTTLNIILSNVLTQDEAEFITLFNIIGIFLTGYMLFFGLVVVHEYGIGKTVFSVLLTAVALCVILFVALLIFDLSQQVYGFVYSLYKEIATRFA